MVTALWQMELPGLWRVPRLMCVVPEETALLYADSAGVSYPRMRLRKLDLTSGLEKASFLTRASVNAIDVDRHGHEVIFNTDNQIVMLTSGLKEVKRWKASVPSYMHSILRFGPLLAMKGFSREELIIYDLEASKLRTKIKCGMGGPVLPDFVPNSVLVACGISATIFEYDLVRGELSQVLSGVFFDGICLDRAQRSIWLYGVKSKDTARDQPVTAENESANVFCRFSAQDGQLIGRFSLKSHPEKVSLSADGARIWIGEQEWHKTGLPGVAIVREINTDDFKEVRQFSFPDGHLLTFVDAAANLILTETAISSKSQRSESETFKLHAWSIAGLRRAPSKDDS